MKVETEEITFCIDETKEIFLGSNIEFSRNDNTLQYSVIVDLSTQTVTSLDIIDEQDNYAETVEAGDLLNENTLKHFKEKARLFVGGNLPICNGYAEIITNPEGFLAHGTIRYYFEMENGNITEIHYSEVSKRIYSFRNISQKEFSKNIKRTKTQYTNDNFQYQLIELD